MLGCTVAAMLGAVRWIQTSIATLMTVSLMFGVYGFDGAIHSVHHLLASDALRHQDVDDNEDDHGTSGADDEQACHVAATASHAAATLVDVLPVVGQPGDQRLQADLAPLACSPASPPLRPRHSGRRRERLAAAVVSHCSRGGCGCACTGCARP